MCYSSVNLLLLFTASSGVRRATAALLRRHALPSVQTGRAAHGRMAGSSQPAFRTAADTRGHAHTSVSTALGTQRFLTPGAGPAAGADTARDTVHRRTLPTVPTAAITGYFVTVSPSVSRLTSALPRPQTYSSILTFRKTCGILAGLPLVASGAVAGVVSDADPSVLTAGLTLSFGVKHEPQGDPSGSVGAGTRRPPAENKDSPG